jgi:hypothetical protein
MKTMLMMSVMAVLLLPSVRVHSQGAPRSFSFNASNISGFPTGQVFMTGGGAYDPETGFVKTGGAFRCLSDINQGPLNGCKAGEGVRWDAVQLLPSTPFKCTGAAGEELKTAATDDHTVVMLADFYRQGDGVHESFTARIIVSDGDQAHDLPGNQTVWIQGVGCGDANTNFR